MQCYKMRRGESAPAGYSPVGDKWVFNAKGVVWAKTQLKRDLRKAAA